MSIGNFNPSQKYRVLNRGIARPGTWRNEMFHAVFKSNTIGEADRIIEISIENNLPDTTIRQVHAGIDWPWLVKQRYIEMVN